LDAYQSKLIEKEIKAKKLAFKGQDKNEFLNSLTQDEFRYYVQHGAESDKIQTTGKVSEEKQSVIESEVRAAALDERKMERLAMQVEQ
jgi:hypothetical protein